VRHAFLDRYARGESPVHRIGAAWKLAIALLVVISVVAVPGRWFGGFAAIGVFLLGVAIASGVPFRFFLTRLLFLEPLAVGIALFQLFRPDGGQLFAAIVIRSTLSLFTMILLISTTPFADLLQVLRRIGIPGILLSVLALLYRYLFVLVDEGERMIRARRARTFGRKTGWGAISMIVSQLFIRSTERSERIYAAMCARGWR
jgi:cobalt/nickel transport system permease protein